MTDTNPRSRVYSRFWLKTTIMGLLMLLTCTGPMHYEPAPLEGSVQDAAGRGLADLHIYSVGVTSELPQTLQLDSLYDSCYTDAQGDFDMAEGYQWRYVESGFGCSHEPIMDMASGVPFGLLLIDLLAETTMVMCVDTCYDHSYEPVDTSSIDLFLYFGSCTPEEENFLGETLYLPVITL